jgi:hypothetical protein
MHELTLTLRRGKVTWKTHGKTCYDFRIIHFEGKIYNMIYNFLLSLNQENIPKEAELVLISINKAISLTRNMYFCSCQWWSYTRKDSIRNVHDFAKSWKAEVSDWVHT